MRIPLGISIAAIAVALGIGWQGHQRLGAARETLAMLASEMDRSSAARWLDGSRDARRTRDQIREEAARLASDWIAHQIKMRSPVAGSTDDARHNQEEELWRRARQLTSAGWQELISRVLEAPDVPDVVRRNLIYDALSTLAVIDPRAALARLDGTPALLTGEYRESLLVQIAIYQLAKVDPLAAAERVRHPGENLAGLMTDQIRTVLVSGVANKDPRLAFKLLGELEFKDPRQPVWNLGESARPPAQKTAVLAALREHLPTLANDDARSQMKTTVLKGLANTFAYGNFGEAKQWFESVNLTPAELAICAEQLHRSVLRPETGQWIEWLGPRLSPDDSRRITNEMMSSWTENDHRAAAEWLSNAAEGPTKNSAITGYVEAIAEYEPEIAARWALTLPAGKERAESLGWVQQKWPEDKAAARDAFAKENGFDWSQ